MESEKWALPEWMTEMEREAVAEWVNKGIGATMGRDGVPVGKTFQRENGVGFFDAKVNHGTGRIRING